MDTKEARYNTINKENTQKLFKRFKFFHTERTTRISLTCYGFECANGWFDLIWKLCEDVEKIAPPDFEVMQVKEKFGTLRYYTHNSTDDIRKLIRKAELKSAHTCELCGSTKEAKCRTLRHQLQTLCNKCYAKAILEE